PASTAASPASSGNSLPEVKVRHAAQPPGRLDDSGAGKLSLAEIEAKMSALRNPGRRATKEWNKILETLSPGDYPELLAYADKNLPKSVRDGWRLPLVTQWAITDPAAAMAYANSLSNKHDRDQAVWAAVTGWAETDAKAASAWVQQLPPGQMRNQAINSIVGFLA